VLVPLPAKLLNIFGVLHLTQP